MDRRCKQGWTRFYNGVTHLLYLNGYTQQLHMECRWNCNVCHMHCVSVHQGPPGPPGPAGTPAPLAEKVRIMSIFVLSTLRQFIHCLHEDLGVDMVEVC